MNFFLITFLIFISNSIFSEEINNSDKKCTISTFASIYYNESSPIPLEELILESDCPSVVQQAFVKNIITLNGTIQSSHLNLAFKEDFDQYSITFIPNEFGVFPLKNKIKELLSLQTEWSINSFSLLDEKKSILLKREQKLTATCSNCNQLGEKSIKLLSHNTVNGETKTIWANITITTRTPTLSSLKNLSVNNQGLSPSDFKKIFIEVTNPENYFVDIPKLAFYKINRPLTVGATLKHSDLTAITLVNTGTPVDVIFVSNSIRISGKALPVSRGQLGESIKMINEKTRKTIIGKVIDFNKVLVEL